MIIRLKTLDASAPRVVEMNANENRVWLFVANINPAIERDEGIAGAGEDGFELRATQLLVDPQCNIERDRLLRRGVTPHGAAVFATMTGIDYDRIEAMAGVRCDRRTTAEKKGGRQSDGGAKSSQ